MSKLIKSFRKRKSRDETAASSSSSSAFNHHTNHSSSNKKHASSSSTTTTNDDTKDDASAHNFPLKSEIATPAFYNYKYFNVSNSLLDFRHCNCLLTFEQSEVLVSGYIRIEIENNILSNTNSNTSKTYKYESISSNSIFNHYIFGYFGIFDDFMTLCLNVRPTNECGKGNILLINKLINMKATEKLQNLNYINYQFEHKWTGISDDNCASFDMSKLSKSSSSSSSNSSHFYSSSNSSDSNNNNDPNIEVTGQIHLMVKMKKLDCMHMKHNNYKFECGIIGVLKSSKKRSNFVKIFNKIINKKNDKFSYSTDTTFQLMSKLLKHGFKNQNEIQFLFLQCFKDLAFGAGYRLNGQERIKLIDDNLINNSNGNQQLNNGNGQSNNSNNINRVKRYILNENDVIDVVITIQKDKSTNMEHVIVKFIKKEEIVIGDSYQIKNEYDFYPIFMSVGCQCNPMSEGFEFEIYCR